MSSGERQSAIGSMIRLIAEQITIARANDLVLTVKLLEMVKLDLQMQLHNISEEELRGFCDWLERPSSKSVAGPAQRRLRNAGIVTKASGRRSSVEAASPRHVARTVYKKDEPGT